MNTARIKAQVAKAIAKMPTHIILMRYEKTPDGMGGYIKAEEPTQVADFEAVLDNSKHSFIAPAIADAGTVARQRTPSLIAIYDPSFTIQQDDEFTVGGITYKVNNPVNILNLDIYWECDLEVIQNG